MSQMYRRPAPTGRSAPSGRGASPGRTAPPGRSAAPRPAPQRGQRSPSGARGRGGRARGAGFGRSWLTELALLVAGGVLVSVLALALQVRWPSGFPLVRQSAAVGAVGTVPEIHSEGPLRINEIMTANRGTLTVEDGSSPDWVEVVNLSQRAVNLRGYSLSKTDSGAAVFTFPEMELGPQECALVYADSRLRAEAHQPLHAPFRLSSSGDTLMLFSPSGTAVDTVNIPALGADRAYVRTERDAWEESANATPGLANTPENLRALSEPSGAGPVALSELVAANDTALPDENGEYYDYIELCNRSGEAVNLEGWYLSDDASQPRKWRFPSVLVEPGGYLVVHASGLDRRDDPAHLHTNFSLSSEGEQLVLTNAQGQMLERVDFGLLKSDQAWALGADGSWRASTPTPGAANP